MVRAGHDSHLAGKCKQLFFMQPELTCPALRKLSNLWVDARAKAHGIHGMAKQKFHPTRLGVFSGAKAYMVCRGPEKTP
jgi:hypothetical protein